jgi:hypothetical protein
LAWDLLVDGGLHHPLIMHQPGGRKINHVVFTTPDISGDRMAPAGPLDWHPNNARGITDGS